MNTRFKCILYGTSLSILAGTAFAQYGSFSSQPVTSPGSQPSSALQGSSQSKEYFHAKDLIGKEARDAKGDRLGKIDDVVFNPQSGEAFAAIGVGSGRFALVPWQAMTVTSTGRRGHEEVTLNTSKDALKSGPTLSSDQWQNLNDPSFTQRVYSQYNLQAPTAVGGATTPGGTSSGAGMGTPPTR